MTWKNRATEIKPSWKDRASEVKEEPSDLGAIIEQTGDVMTLGYLPQIKAAMGSLLPDEEARAYLNAPLTKVFDPEFQKEAEKLSGKKKSYVELRDEYIEALKKQKEEQPVASAIGTGLGLVGSAVSVPAKLFGGTATLGQAIGTGVKTGAAYGALSNPGDVKGEVSPVQLGERGFNAVTGAALGGAAGGVGYGAEKLLSKVPEKLEKFAGERAYKALGRGTKKEAEALGEEGVQKIGQAALKENVIGVLPKSKQGLQESVEEGIKKVGEALGDNVDKLDDFERELASKGERLGLSKINLAEELEGRLVDNTLIGSDSVNNAVNKRIDKILSSEGGESFGIKEAQKLKEKLGNSVPWNKLKISGKADLTPEQQVDLELYNMLSERTLAYADALADRIGGDTSSKVKELRNLYSQYMKMKKLTDSEAARELTNRIISPSDIATGIGGAIVSSQSGDPLQAAGLGLILGGGHKLARQYGSQVAARGAQTLANQASKFIPKIGQMTSKAGVTSNQLVDIWGQYEKMKNRHISEKEAGDMYINQGNGK